MPPTKSKKVPPAPPTAKPKKPKPASAKKTSKPKPKTSKTPKSKNIPPPPPEESEESSLDESESSDPEDVDQDKEKRESEKLNEKPKKSAKRKQKDSKDDDEDKQRSSRPNQIVTSRAEIKMTMIYAGGTDLFPFRSEFWRVAKVNQWPEDYQVVVLSSQLAGLAKTYVDNLLDDYADTVTPTDIFAHLESKFMSSEAMALAQSRLNDMRQLPTEDVRTFSARFMKAMKACGQQDNTLQAINFFRATRALGKLPYDSAKFTSIHKVTAAVRDWELTQEWVDKLESKSEHKSLKRAARSDDHVSAGEDDYDADEQQGTKRKFAKVVSYTVNEVGASQRPRMERDAHQQQRDVGDQQWSQSSHPMQPSNERSQPQVVTCQLCQAVGHVALECPTLQARTSPMVCSHCSQTGHAYYACPQKGFCTHCSKYGHSIETCWTAGAPNGRGRGRGGPRGNGRGYGSFDQRPQFSGRIEQQRPVQIKREQDGYAGRDVRCYKCNGVGHYARDCAQQPLRKQPQHSHHTVQQVKQESRPELTPVELQRLAATVQRRVEEEARSRAQHRAVAEAADPKN